MKSAPPRDLVTTAKLSMTHLARAEAPVRTALLVYARDGAEVVPLAEGASVVVGRAPPSDVIVEDVSLSRRHARFTLEGGALTVEDLGSSNGTLLRGEAIESAALHAGDELALGSVIVAVQAAGGDARLGLLGYDRVRDLGSTEIARCRYFGRRLALLVVRPARAAGSPPAHYRAFYPRVLAALRPVDRLAVYSDDTLLALLPELDSAGALGIATRICASEGAPLVCGAASFPEAGTSVDDLLAAAGAASREATPAAPVQLARGGPAQTLSLEGAAPIARSPSMRAALDTVRRVARGSIPVLLLGETGSGKEIVARFLHEASPRRERPLVSVNCGAIAPSLLESTLFGHERGAFTGAVQQQKGVFETADGGAVLLDEVGELPPPAQAALLRVLETKQITRVGGARDFRVDVRVIAATHRDLEAMCAEGRFREDLLYRLNTVIVSVPPLRERPEDIDPLVELFLERASRQGGARSIDAAALEVLRAHGWPGNVRELRNAIERAVVIAPGDTIGVDDLPERVRAAGAILGAAATPARATPGGPGALSVGELDGDFRSRMERLEAAVLSHALEQAGHNQTETARRLGMPLRTLVHKIGVHGIRRPRP